MKEFSSTFAEDLAKSLAKDRAEAVKKKDEPESIVENLSIRKISRDYYVEVPLANGRVFIKFAEIVRSRQSFEAVVSVRADIIKEGLKPAYETRIDLNSASAVSMLCTNLNAAFGNKKEGYNWAYILNRAGNAMKHLIQQEKQPTVLGADVTYENTTYLVEHFLEAGSPTLVHGDGSTGKSYFCLYMAACAALKLDFFGKKTLPFKTLYIDHEATITKLKNRLFRISNNLEVPFTSLSEKIHWYKPEGSIASEQEIIARMVEDGGYGCIIVDAGASASGGSPMDEQAVLRLFNALDHIPCAKLVIHHEPKNSEGSDDKAYYGTTFWRNAPRVAWRLKREVKEGTKSIIKAIHHKSNDDRESEPITYSMDFADDPPRVKFEVVDHFEKSDEAKVLEYLTQGGADLDGVIDAIGSSRTSAQRTIDDLMSKGKIERKREGKKYLYFVPKNF